MVRGFGKKMIKGSVLALISTVVVTLANYLFRTILARSFTVAEFGLIFSIISLFGLLTPFLGLGMTSALVVYLAESQTKKKFDRIKRIIQNVLAVQIVTAVVIGGLFLIGAGFLAEQLFNAPEAAHLIVLFALYTMVLPFVRTFTNAFMGLQHIGSYVLANSLKPVLLLLATVILLLVSKTLGAVFLAHIISAVVLAIITGYILKKRSLKGFPKVPFKIEKPLIKKLIHFGIPLAISGVAGIIFGRLDSVLLAKLATIEEVGLYNTAFPIVAMIWGLVSFILIPYTPMITEGWAKKDVKFLKNTLTKIYTYVTVLCIPCVITLLLLPEPILSILFGQKYVVGAAALQILSFGVLFRMLLKINTSILPGIYQPFEATKTFIIGGIFNIVANIILIPLIGIHGAALATIASFLLMLIYSIVKVRKHIPFTVKGSLLGKLILPTTLFTILVVAAKLIPVHEAVILFIGAPIAGIIYALGIVQLRIIPWKEVQFILKTVLKKK